MSPRARYIVRRLFQAIPVIIAMSIFVFLMIHLVPGDPVQTMLGFRATPENVATVRAQLGLDRPLLAQYLDVGGWCACTGTSGRTSSATSPSRRCSRSGCR